MLIGRGSEEAQLDALLEQARTGRSSALILCGVAGIGKTALLEYAISRAAGFRVVRATGIESEAEIVFAGLQQLLAPVETALGELPDHQARALSTGLGIVAGPAPDRLVISAATLSLLAAAADERPLLGVVDDAQWLDHASAETLTFVARRLGAESVVLLFAAREPDRATFLAEGIPRLEIAGLGVAAATTFLRLRAPDLAELTVSQLVGLTRGNPLALLEVSRGLNAAQRAGRSPLDDPLPVTIEIERVYCDRASALSVTARRALLLVAASDAGDIDALWETLARDGLDEAEKSGLLLPGEPRFCHPLARSAVYQRAPPVDRRAAHLALAAATSEPDRRAWHLAAAADGPDEEVAAALERAAAAALGRGGFAAEARALERAAELTADPETRAQRMLNAAEAAEACGWFEHAEMLLDDVTRLTQNPAIRAPAVARRSYLLADRGEFDRAYALSVDEAERAAPQDAALALALGALMALTHSLDIPRSLATAEKALLLAGSDADSDCLLCENVARTFILAGRDAEARSLVKSALLHVDPASVVAVNLGTDLFYIEDYPRARDVLERVVRLTREAAASGILSYALDQLAKLETRVGDLMRAYALEVESLHLTEPLGNKVALAATLAWLGLIEAMLGRDESTAHSLQALKIAEATNDRYNVVRARASLALDSLANGDAARAVTWLEPVAKTLDDGGVVQPNFFRIEGDLVEALARTGRTDEAMQRLIRLDAQGRAVDSAWARVAVARCRAFLVPARELPSGVESALELHEREASAFERARTELCYGERLRRTRERKLARQHLRSSHATFERLGARTWSERARVELEATGEHVRKRDPTAAERLTPQEFQIAMLVAEGLTNRDVGARMFLSPKTVEFHLSRVFRKLDVRARGELIRLFAGGTGAEAPQRPGPDVSQSSSSPWSRPSETSTRSPSIGPPP